MCLLTILTCCSTCQMIFTFLINLFTVNICHLFIKLMYWFQSMPIGKLMALYFNVIKLLVLKFIVQ